MFIEDFISRFIFNEHSLVVDVKDVMTVLAVLGLNSGIGDKGAKVRHCRWVEQPDKWLIRFSTSDKNWTKMIIELNKDFRLLIVDRPGYIYLERR